MQHSAGVVAVVFSPRADRIVTGSQDGTWRLWDARTGVPLGKPMRHKKVVSAVAFSPQGDRLLTAGGDYSPGLWDALTGAPLGFSKAKDAEAESPTPTWHVMDTPQSPEGLTAYFELMSGHAVDADGNARRLSAAEREERWRTIRARDANWLNALEAAAERRMAQDPDNPRAEK